MILDTIAQALSEGCGKTLASVLQSKRYGEILGERQALSARYPDHTDVGIALRAGHFTMGQLLNSLPEEEAVKRAQGAKSPFTSTPEMEALVQVLGDELVAAADACLPEEAIAMAKEWQGASTKRQMAICRELFFLFSSEEQRKEREMAPDTFYEGIAAYWRHQGDGPEAILPRLYGQWNRKGCPANCQGKTQMLIAFARRAGADVLTALNYETPQFPQKVIQ